MMPPEDDTALVRMVPGRWWRAVDAGGKMKAESSDPEEIRRFAAEEEGWTVQRWHTPEPNVGDWRPAE